MKKMIFGVSLFLMPYGAFAEDTYCGLVDIDQLLAGPRHDSMMKISNQTCGGYAGWVCLDPEGEHMSKEVSTRLYSLILAAKMANKKLEVTIDASLTATACAGPYPIATDIRVS